jgi:hypothetical protein
LRGYNFNQRGYALQDLRVHQHPSQFGDDLHLVSAPAECSGERQIILLGQQVEGCECTSRFEGRDIHEHLPCQLDVDIRGQKTLTRSRAGTVQQAVNLRSVLFHCGESEAGDGEQLRRRRGTIGRDGFQRLVAEDAECGNSTAFGFG